MISTLTDFNRVFFIGIAGSGMSALAQYLQGVGKHVCGSDRYFFEGELNPARLLLEKEGITCYAQNGEGIVNTLDLVVVSTAVEEDVFEVKKARSLGIPVIRRSELLSFIIHSKPTIAVGGTSGKSTTAAMIYTILEYAGWAPSIISGAGLVSIMDEGKIGNAKVGQGDWLIVEADESDGSIVQYHPSIGVLLNIDKDHKEVEDLMSLFSHFKDQSGQFIVNRSHPLSASLSQNPSWDFALHSGTGARYEATDITASGMEVAFKIDRVPFLLHLPGKHNVENALAAVTVANMLGIEIPVASKALTQYRGIYRRHQLIGKHKGVWLIDDYAHNPVKCAASIAACQPLAPKVIAWFQPHGYGPTRFLRQEFVQEFTAILRDTDELWMSEIYYAGGTASKDISAADLVNEISSNGKHAYFIEDRDQLMDALRPRLSEDCVLLLMGARDPALEAFAKKVWKALVGS